MQTRLLACLAGGFFGVVVASPISGSLGVSATLGLIGCSLAGIAVGYVVSTLFDVFTAHAPDTAGSSASNSPRQSRPE